MNITDLQALEKAATPSPWTAATYQEIVAASLGTVMNRERGWTSDHDKLLAVSLRNHAGPLLALWAAAKALRSYQQGVTVVIDGPTPPDAKEVRLIHAIDTALSQLEDTP